MWHGILGHDDVVERFRNTVQRGRLASTYLFVGPPGIGKRRFARQLAQALLCPQADEALLEPCGQCESCRLCVAGNHPDLDEVALPPGKAELPIALLIGDKEHRHQQGLCHRISLKPFLGGRKIAIIDDADHFNQESANCLLKTLEEPPPHSLLILLGTSPTRQLPTIRSRAQIVRFRPLPPDAVKQILLEQGIADDERASTLARLSEGSVEKACQLMDAELWSFRERFLAELARGSCDGVRMAQSTKAFVDEAGQEAALRRDRLRTIVAMAIEFYRGQLYTQFGSQSPGREPAQAVVQGSIHPACVMPAHCVLEALDHCLDTLQCVDRNANLALVIQQWCESLAGSGASSG